MRDERALRSCERYPDPAPCPTDGRDRRWLERATRAAAAAGGRWKVACILVRGGRVLSVAVNSERNDPAICPDRLWGSSEHAEEAAIRMCRDPRGATAYIVRVGRDGTLRHAQPCNRCAALLARRSVRPVWSCDPEYLAQRAAGH